MKLRNILPCLLLLLAAMSAQAATWYATSSSVNVNALLLWVPTSTGSCAGSGTALVWGAQSTGDVFDANGCTALAINSDPGSVGEVTIQANASTGGGFTCSSSSGGGPSTIHANVAAGTTAALTITGSGAIDGCNISGNITGGSAASAYGVYINTCTSCFGALTITGNLLGGSNASGYAVYASGYAPTIVGNATGGNAPALDISANNGSTIAGLCIAGSNNGCNVTGTQPITITGGIVNSGIVTGASQKFRFSNTVTNYIVNPINSSFVIANCLTAAQIAAGICTNAQVLVANPGVGFVANGTLYGPFTGTATGLGNPNGGGGIAIF